MSDLLGRLQLLKTAVLANVMHNIGLPCQTLPFDLHSTVPAKKLAATVLTAQGDEDQFSPRLENSCLDDAVFPGCVVLLDTQHCLKGAVMDGSMVNTMLQKGAAGFVVLGGIRDSEELINNKVPVYYQYRSPFNAHAFWSLKSVAQTIQVDGLRGKVTIRNGDYLVADGDGIVIVPKQNAEQIVRDAEIASRR